MTTPADDFTILLQHFCTRYDCIVLSQTMAQCNSLVEYSKKVEQIYPDLKEVNAQFFKGLELFTQDFNRRRARLPKEYLLAVETSASQVASEIMELITGPTLLASIDFRYSLETPEAGNSKKLFLYYGTLLMLVAGQFNNVLECRLIERLVFVLPRNKITLAT